MTMAPVDPRFALDAANSQDLVQKKLSIDAMKKRVSGGPSEEKKLREACEGFESIFLQKMWEQMRKNVKKEGYLHSKDEEAYQSMFDTELAKKMATAGGVGLGDMLYEQLSQKLTYTSRTTGAGAMRTPLPIEPARDPEPQPEPVAPQAKAPEDLYSETEKIVVPAPARETPLEAALVEIAQKRDPALNPANATYPMFDMQTGNPMNPVAGRMKEGSEPKREFTVSPLPERVSAPGKARPSSSGKKVGRSASHSRRSGQSVARGQSPTQMPGQAPVQTPGQVATQPSIQAPTQIPQAAPASRASNVVPDGPAAAPISSPSAAVKGQWPVAGEIVSNYGRQVGVDGTLAWNTGVQFAAAENAPVASPMDGMVAFIGEKGGLPQIILQHADGLTSHYTNTRSALGVGDAVFAGTEFASVASGGAFVDAGTAGRMGFEIRRGELALNPEKLIG